jgi:hypothetical protein
VIGIGPDLQFLVELMVLLVFSLGLIVQQPGPPA